MGRIGGSMTPPVPPPASETIVQVESSHGSIMHPWMLTLSCGHTVYWDGPKPDIGKALRCPEPECHPITIVKGVSSNE